MITRTQIIAFRKKMIGNYRSLIRKHCKFQCEVSEFLRNDPEYCKWEYYHKLPSLEVHHIYGRGGIDHEHFSNYCLVSNAAHGFGHDNSPKKFEIACLWSNMKKREMLLNRYSILRNVDEGRYKAVESMFDPKHLSAICKRASFRGRVEMLGEDVAMPLYAKACGEIIEFMNKNGYGDS